MRTALSTTVVSYGIVNIRYRKFKNKDYSIQEAKRSPRSTDIDKARLWERMEEDQYSTIRELAK